VSGSAVQPRADNLPGILLTNLGTPAAPTATAVRAYLRQFLADRFVIDAPRLQWWLIRQLFILPWRPRRKVRAYREIWTDDGSPLLQVTERQAEALQREVRERLDRVVPVAIGMRYGRPSIATGCRTLAQAGCNRLLLLPLFPQYSATTVGSTVSEVVKTLGRWKATPELRAVGGYSSHEGYIQALANSITEIWDTSGPSDRLLISFHGLPKRYADLGDPYADQCRTTANLLADRLDLDRDRWAVSFQSRFGREEWLQPYTDETLMSWGRQQIETVDVVCPGFAADCLETLEEIAVTGQREFNAAGGGRLRYIPALNDRDDHIDALVDMATVNLRAWV